MFHSDYKFITDKLPARENTKGFSPFPQPIPPEQISDKYDRIEDHLRHTLEVYRNSLDW